MHFLTYLTAFVAAAATTEATTVKRRNLQLFAGVLGAPATPVLTSTNPDRPFSVRGDTFVNINAALQRSCDQQFNACANLANANGGKCFSVSDCQAQKDQCSTAITACQTK